MGVLSDLFLANGLLDLWTRLNPAVSKLDFETAGYTRYDTRYD